MTQEETTARAAGEETPPTRLQRLAALYGHVSDVLTIPRIGALLGLVVIVLVGAVGGWGGATEAAEEAPTAAVGTPIEAEPFEVTVRRARFFDELRPSFYAEDGFRYLALSVDVTPTATEPVGGAVFARAATLEVPGLRTIDLSSGPKVADPQVVRTADGLTQHTFQPGLTTNVVLVWQQEIGETLPAQVSLTLARHTLRRSSMDGTLGWRDPSPVAGVTLALEPLAEP